MHNMTIYLPRSVNKFSEFSLGPIKNQKDAINAPAWRLIHSSVEYSGLRLNIGTDNGTNNWTSTSGMKNSARTTTQRHCHATAMEAKDCSGEKISDREDER